MARKRDAAQLTFPPSNWHHSAWQKRVWKRTERLARPRVIFLNAGRGAGKDIITIRCILRDALKLYQAKKAARKNGTSILELNPLVKIWVIAPQDNNLKQTWDDWKGTLSGLAREWAAAAGFEENETDWLFREIVRENKLVLFGRGEIEIESRLSSTRDALRGPGVDFVHWTEFATETVPGEIERAFRGELPGTVTRAGRLGRIYTTTTPKGLAGGYFDELKARFGDGTFQGVENGELISADGLNYYYHTDCFSNEFLTPEQIEQMEAERVNGWLFEQERLAKFVVGDLGGEKAFERAWVEKCLVGSPAKREGYRQIVFGIDIARLGDDETCHVGVDDETGDLVRVEFHKKRTGQEIVQDLIRLNEEFPGCLFYLDSTGHRGYIADFAPSWLPITETQFSREKEKWVGGLRMLLQMAKLRIPDPETYPGLSAEEKTALRKLIKQLLQFMKVVKRSGTIEFRHPQGEKDDGVDGLMLATMRLATRLQETLGAKGTKEKLRKMVV